MARSKQPAPAPQDFLPFTRPSIDEETIAGVGDVLRSGWITTGPQVAAFEAALSAYLSGRPVRTFTSATGALEVALQICGIGAGDEVIVPAMTFAATANVVLRVGARPVFVDVGIDSRNIDVEQAAKAVTPRTRAIMPVHFAGLPVDLDAVYALAARHDLRVIEDAAHAIGSAYKGRRIGSFGDLVAFSFHPNKNMTTIEGGALSLPDAAATAAAELQRFHGISKDQDGNLDVLLAGGKYNLTDVAARVGLGQLKQLDGFNERRRALAKRYFDKLDTAPAFGLPASGDNGHSWHMFAPLLPLDRLRIGRGEFIRRMHDRGIGIGIHYPAMHLFSVFHGLGYRDGQFPNAEKIGRETVTFPLFPAMKEDDIDRVCAAAIEIVEDTRS